MTDPLPDSLLSLFVRPEPGERILLRRGPMTPDWRAALSARRLVAAALLTPLLYLADRAAISGTPPSGPGWTALLLAVAAIGALALATYLPQDRAGAGSSPCAAIAGAWVFVGWLTLAGPADPVNGLLALLMVSVALVQRLRGAAACGSPSR